MPNQRLIALNSNNGAMVVVVATVYAVKRVEVREDEANIPQGIIFQTPLDGFTGTDTVGPLSIAGPPLVIQQGTVRPVSLGGPAQGTAGAFNFVAASNILKAKSKTAQPTTIVVTENE